MIADVPKFPKRSVLCVDCKRAPRSKARRKYWHDEHGVPHWVCPTCNAQRAIRNHEHAIRKLRAFIVKREGLDDGEIRTVRR